jgi:hypothetical protein
MGTGLTAKEPAPLEGFDLSCVNDLFTLRTQVDRHCEVDLLGSRPGLCICLTYGAIELHLPSEFDGDVMTDFLRELAEKALVLAGQLREESMSVARPQPSTTEHDGHHVQDETNDGDR